VPFKQQAWELLADRSPRAAEAAGAVNTIIVLDGGLLRGDNTDGVGLVRDLTATRASSFAASGAVARRRRRRPRVHSGPLLAAGPAALDHRQSHRGKGGQLANACGDDVSRLWPRRPHRPRFDLIVNATSSGLPAAFRSCPETVLADGGWTYDMFYGDRPTPFCRWGQAQGAARALDGLGMLVEQAAESFRLWRGVRPRTEPVIDRLHPVQR
jgi:shikimate dehydrogenase